MDLKKRLNSIMEKDKTTNPKYLTNVIKSDFFYLISNYFEVDFNDIDIEIVPEQNFYNISISAKGDRMKLMKTLPE